MRTYNPHGLYANNNNSEAGRVYFGGNDCRDAWCSIVGGGNAFGMDGSLGGMGSPLAACWFWCWLQLWAMIGWHV